MTRTRILTTANIIYLTIAAMLFLAFLFSQPITAAEAVLGFTATAAATSVSPTPTLVPPTSTLEPVATYTPAPTSTLEPVATSPPAAPTSRPAPQATSVSVEPTPTLAVILPISGSGTSQSGALFWVGGGAALFLGWLLHCLRQARRNAQT